MKYKKHHSPSLSVSFWLAVYVTAPSQHGSGKFVWEVAWSAGKSSGLDRDDS